MVQFYSYLWLREDTTPYYAGKGTGNRAFVSHTRVHPPRDRSRILIFLAQNEGEAFESEMAFIKWFGRKDNGTGVLRNLTDGGEGKTGRVVNLETRRRMSEAQKGNKKSLGHKNNLGNHHTQAWKDRMSAVHKGQNNRLGSHLTDEHKTKNRTAMLAYWRRKERKTHCPTGHLLSEENCIVYYWKQGRKKCRICANASGRRHYLKKKSHDKFR